MTNEKIVFKAVDLVSAYVNNHSVEQRDLPDLLESVTQSIQDLVEGKKKLIPAVPIGESIQEDYLICLEDGEEVTLLKRYLKTNFNMTPEEYREKWDLPDDYPMVASSYSQKRSKIAKNMGLGKS